jgi:SAM-dependent methyltransferase
VAARQTPAVAVFRCRAFASARLASHSPEQAARTVTRLYSEDAELYDIAFDWDIEEEVTWILERLAASSVLEPGCGSGRLLGALACRGVEVTGVDLSPEMVALAKRRLGTAGTVELADMTDFDLRRTFGGAVSPINTLLHLDPRQLARHLDCVARHLPPGAVYLVQVGLATPESVDDFAGSHWEASRGETKLRVHWTDEELDFAAGRSRQRSRVEILSGPRAGEVVEEIHEMTLWTPPTWRAAIAESPFTVAATYDGNERSRPRVSPDAVGGLLWHELVRA